MDSHEERFQQLTGVVDKLCTTDKNHSFQIVSLQNQIQAIQNERKQEAEERRLLKHSVVQLRAKIAYLKGKLAKLTVEFHSAQAVPSGATAARFDTPAHRRNISSGTYPRNHAADTADQFSVEQTSPRGSELDSAQMSQPLDAQTKNEPNELDQMHFYDARENMTDDGSKIKTGGNDDDFSLGQRLQL